VAHAGALRGGDGVLPVAVGQVVARDEHERVAVTQRGLDSAWVVVVDDGSAHPSVSEVLDCVGRSCSRDDLGGRDAAIQQVLDDEAPQVPGSGRDDDGHGCQLLVGREGGYGVTR
jgi:hypothetical protein